MPVTTLGACPGAKNNYPVADFLRSGLVRRFLVAVVGLAQAASCKVLGTGLMVPVKVTLVLLN